MTPVREVWLTPLDRRLLLAIERTGNLVRACQDVGIGRDRGVYRLRRMEQAVGGPVVRTYRGGTTGGSTHLTPRGSLLASSRGEEPLGPGRSSVAPASPSTILHGTWHARPSPQVDVAPHLRLEVAFEAEEGEPVVVGIPPESVLLARQPVATSARNRWEGEVRSCIPSGTGSCTLEVDVRGVLLRVLVTARSVRELRIAPGRRVYLLIKATAVHRWD